MAATADKQLRVEDTPAGILDLILQKVPKEELADKIRDALDGNVERDTVSLLKMLLEAYQKQESVSSSKFGINTSAIITASRLAMQDEEFLGVLATAIAEKRALLQRGSGRIRRDIAEYTFPVVEDAKKEDADASSGAVQSGEPESVESADSERVYEPELSGTEERSDTGVEGNREDFPEEEELLDTDLIG